MSRTYLLIGGNSGIGKAFLNQELENGHRIVACSREPDTTFSHPQLTQYAYDAANESSVLSCPDAIDGLIYMPGSIQLKPFHRIALSDFRNELEINLMGAINTIQKALPALKKGSQPSVLLFSTVAVQTGMPFHSGIASAKGAVEGLVRSLAAEYAPHIRFNAIAPSLIDTPLAEALLNNEKKRENSALRHPLKRIGSAAELAEAAAYLMSEKASWVTGQIMRVDGGMSSLRTL
jgi:NAD(P)-dependent dehydrogenase (short-subunit alcohol dehydrogenase family)